MGEHDEHCPLLIVMTGTDGTIVTNDKLALQLFDLESLPIFHGFLKLIYSTRILSKYAYFSNKSKNVKNANS